VFIVFDYNYINLILNQFLGGTAVAPLPPHALAAPQFLSYTNESQSDLLSPPMLLQPCNSL